MVILVIPIDKFYWEWILWMFINVKCYKLKLIVNLMELSYGLGYGLKYGLRYGLSNNYLHNLVNYYSYYYRNSCNYYKWLTFMHKKKKWIINNQWKTIYTRLKRKIS